MQDAASTLRQILVELRLRPECARLYVDALQMGYLAVAEANDEAIGLLEKDGFIFRESDANGNTTFVANDPVLVSASLLNRWNWRYPPFDSSIEHFSAATFLQKVETAKLLAQELLKHAPARASSTSSGFKYLDGEDAISTFIARQVSQADAVFGITAAQWTTNLSLIWGSIEKRLKEGLKYRRIAGERTIVAFGNAINRRDVLDTGVELRGIEASELTEVFYLITSNNRVSAIVFNEGYVATRREATYIDNRALLEPLVERAEYLWKRAAPASAIFDFLEAYRRQYLAEIRDHFGVTAETVAARIFDRGIFTDLSDLDDRIVMNAIESLRSGGWILPYSLPIGPFTYIVNATEPLGTFLSTNYGRAEGHKE